MSDGTSVNVTGAATLSTSNSGICLVSPTGLLTALLPGTCNLTAVFQGISKTVPVTVTL